MTKWSIPIHKVQVQTCDYTSAKESVLLKKVTLFYVDTQPPSNTQNIWVSQKPAYLTSTFHIYHLSVVINNLLENQFPFRLATNYFYPQVGSDSQG